MIAAAKIMNGSANHKSLIKTAWLGGVGQSFSINEKITPLSFIESKFQSKPPDTYRTDDAKMFGNQVIG